MKIPLAHEIRMEIASEVADILLPAALKELEIKIALNEDGTLTDRAQDVYNRLYDEVEGILADVIGEEDDQELLGLESADRTTLDKKTIAAFAEAVGSLHGDPVLRRGARPGQRSIAGAVERVVTEIAGE